ncbi:MAG: amidohydrolase family protein [Gemmatimonadetes bacterium]|nr:amidohydrolase family protein [Gemmatimonadota bacterium]
MDERGKIVKSFTRSFVAMFALPTGLAAQNLALTEAVVLNPADESIHRGVVVIEDGRIRGLTDALPPDFDGPTLSLGDRYVIPALADLHTHSFGNASPGGMPQLLGPQGTARAALYTGVAFVLDLFSPEDMILGFRDGQRADGPQGAMLFAAGPCLTATNGHCSEYGVPTRIVDTPEDARREVADLAGKAPDVVKIVYDHQSYGGRSMPTVDLATLTAVLESARQHGLRTVVHIGTWQDVRDAVLAGADAITHTPGPQPPPADLAALMVESGTYHIPTLAVQSEFARMVDDPGLLDDPLLTETVPQALRDMYRDFDPSQAAMPRWLEYQRILGQPSSEAVKHLADAGVPMLAGTDGGNPGVFQGYSVHRELELFEAAGLPRWAVLRSATTDAARFLGRRWGVEPGDEATLLILDASPLESIGHTKRIHAVIQTGVVVDRQTLRVW